MNRSSLCLAMLLGVVAVFCVGFLDRAALAADNKTSGLDDAHVKNGAVEIANVTLGFDGVYKLGYWMPIEIRLTLPPELRDTELHNTELWVVVPDGDSTPTRYTLPVEQNRTVGQGRGAGTSEATNASPSAVVVRGNIKIGRPNGEVHITLRRAGRILAERRLRLSGPEVNPALDSDRPLVVSIGSLPAVERSLREYAQAKSVPLVVAAVATADRLPKTWFGYEGVDVVVVNASSDMADELAAYPEQLAALRRWIQSGGRMILGVAGDGATLPPSLAAGGPLSDFLPGQVEGVVPFTDTILYEEFCRTADPLRAKASSTAALWQIPHLVAVRGRVVLSQGEDPAAIPLVIHSPYGLGEVVFLAADLESEVIDAWNGTGTLLARLLPKHMDVRDSTEMGSTPIRSVHKDLTGQLRAALDNFERDGVERIPFWLVATLAIVYLALIAPGDYWFLRRLRGHMEWTWLTFPVIVLFACVVAWTVARGAKGDTLRINQAEVVDIDVPLGKMWGTVWLTIFSPATEQYRLGLDVSLPVKKAGPPSSDSPSNNSPPSDSPSQDIPSTTLISWQGLPGSALGGMRSPAATTNFKQPYSVSPGRDVLEQVPISIWSTKTFRARYQRSTDATVELNVTLDPGSVEPELIGSVTNRLDIPLDQCVLIYRRSVYKLGRLEPGVPVPLPEQWAADSVQSFLTQNRKYDQESNDAYEVLQAIMFHEQAGGTTYTHLNNQYEAYLDLTHQLKAGRPILVGRAKQSVASAKVSSRTTEAGEARGHTIFRFLFDEPSSAGPDSAGLGTVESGDTGSRASTITGSDPSK